MNWSRDEPAGEKTASRLDAEIPGVSDFGSAGQRHRCADARVSERLEQTLKPSRRAMKTFASVHIFDLNNSGAPSTHSIDGMHTEPAVANEP